MQFLKQSTAVTVLLGPFLDATNGVDNETGLVAAMDTATTGIRISKNALAFSDKSSATATVHREAGHYAVHLDATDTGTIGHLRVQYDDSTTCTHGWEDFTVVSGVVYEELFSANPSVIEFTCDATGAQNSVNTSLSATYTTNDAFVGRVLVFDLNTTTAALAGQTGTITAYDGSTGAFTFAANTFTAASVSGDTGKIY